ncbi:peroxiredoxin-like family protein [Agrococcus jejuensis]|uniref:peroxiredoxin-like family protein n=1 Tax=Agrococcus jejuensis TaxID=399736 RepID=UPI0011A74BD3|nr:peroxiredoxin-like family protein [Agrococcus jejuensis]
MTTSTRTVADQVSEFDVGFAETIGPDLSAVFAKEQADLNAAGTPAGAVAAGDPLPDATLTTVDGQQVTLASVLDGAPAVIVFYRGAWCPYCNITLQHYEQTLAATLREQGVGLVAISPQTPDGSQAAVANGELSFTVLSDPANALASQLGIVTAPSAEAQEAHTTLGFAVQDSNADDTPGIPFPTVLVVDASGTVRFADVHVDYTTRTETEEILEAVAAL